MTSYELTFAVPSFTDDQLDKLTAMCDAIGSEGHGRTEIAMLVDAADAHDAYTTARRVLGTVGIEPTDFIPDFVTRAEIAHRAGVSTQAVGQWVRGERGHGFPMAAFNTPGEIWHWGDVIAWLRARGIAVDDDVAHPTRAEAEAMQFRTWDHRKVDGGWKPATVVKKPSLHPSSASRGVKEDRRSSWGDRSYPNGVIPMFDRECGYAA